MAVVDEWRRDDADYEADEQPVATADGAKSTGKVVLVRNHEGDVGVPYLTGRLVSGLISITWAVSVATCRIGGGGRATGFPRHARHAPTG